MYIDALLQFSSAQAITSTARSTNVVDLSVARDMGVGEDLYICLTVDEAFTASGSATLTITLETDDNAAFSSAGVLFSTPAIGKAALTLNVAPMFICVPMDSGFSFGVNWERYISLNYTVATGPMTAGKITAAIVQDVQKSKAYASGFTSA
jgi:hypothetical protein